MTGAGANDNLFRARLHPLQPSNRLVETLQELFTRHPEADVVRLTGAPLRMFYCRHPEHIQQIVLGKATRIAKLPAFLPRVRSMFPTGLFSLGDGAAWRERRLALAAHFSEKAAPQFLPALAPALARCEAAWERAAGRGEALDLFAEMRHLICDYAFRAFLSHELGDELGQVEALAHELIGDFSLPLPLWVPAPTNWRFRRAKRQLIAIVDRILARRLAAPADPHHDLVAILRQALGSAATLETLRDEFFSIFFGAHTMSVPLTWVFYLAATERQAGAELGRALANAAPSAAGGLAEIPEVQRFFDEATRLYPPVWTYGRFTADGVSLGASRIPPGSMLLVGTYFAHRHPRFWPEAEAFRPERFDPANAGERHSFAHLPFGGGPRMCLGAKLAPMICLRVFAHLMRRFDVATEERVGMRFAFELTPDRRIALRATVRSAVAPAA